MNYIVSTPYMTEEAIVEGHRLEMVYDNLPAAMAQFYRRIGRYQVLTGEVLTISIAPDIKSWQRRELDYSEYVVASHEGGDEIADAEIWVKRS